ESPTNSSGRVSIAIAGEGEPYPTAPFPTGEWVLVAATLDRQGRQRLFINGELKAEVQRPADGVPTPCDRDFYLGANFGVEAFFRGRLDEVRLYNRALTPEEIAATAAQSSSPVSPSGPT
ncbi:MAG TPA: LamG domain-containing protein, partial [Armatimonadetes bacterium]|nr:LamG domain-containing protein [Armatimonadota bacterium]